MKISAVTSGDKTFTELAIEHLRTLPNDEVCTIEELGAAIGRKPPTCTPVLKKLKNYAIAVRINGYRQWVYGNEKALNTLRKRLANETSEDS